MQRDTVTTVSHTAGRRAVNDATSHPVVSVARTMGMAALVAYALLAAVLVVAGLALTHVGALHAAARWDDHLNVWAVHQRTPWMTRASGWFTGLANTMGIVVVAALVTVVLLVRRSGRRALLLVVGLPIELASFLTANYVVRRPRPHVHHLGSTPTTFSWPSGHVAATFVLYGGIAVLIAMATRNRFARISAWLVAIVLTLGVAASRVYRGDHHFLDVVAGLTLGVVALAAAHLAVRRAEAVS
jgi:membrane-associated phospholipid phosphatase